jgi:hypothetical protein
MIAVLRHPPPIRTLTAITLVALTLAFLRCAAWLIAETRSALKQRGSDRFWHLVPGGALPPVGTRASFRLMAHCLIGESAVLFEEDFEAFRVAIKVVVPWWRAPWLLWRGRKVVSAFERSKAAHVVVTTRFVVACSMGPWREREARS